MSSEKLHGLELLEITLSERASVTAASDLGSISREEEGQLWNVIALDREANGIGGRRLGRGDAELSTGC